MVLAAGLWFAACTAGALGVVTALLDHDALRSTLSETALANDPTAGADLVDAGVRATIALILGSVTLLVAVSLVWTVLVLRRHSWARWLLLVTGALSLAAADVAQSVVLGGADLDRIAFVVQAGLILLAAVVLFTKPSRAWLRRSVG